MSTRMLIDARHDEETRVAVVRSNRVEEFDYESAAKRQLKGNIYLAKVTRVEPSLQACFVDYGGNRHGFLAFNEIHPDYYQIPHEDREALLKAEEEAARSEADRREKGSKSAGDGDVEEVAGEVDLDELTARQTSALRRKYKIQEVIKRRQILLVQVVKEERGTKGAALTTYLSLAGRYCVVMPNSPHAGGISRKIGNAADRKKLKGIMSALEVPDGMGCIIRTAGLNRTRAEIKRDFDYLLRLWDGIRELTLKSIAPTLIYEEANLIKRTIRDLYTRDIDEVLVEGEEGYRLAKDFMKLLIPSHAKRIKHYRDRIPLFHRFQVEPQLESMYSPIVQLKSGGYVVINPTEALVAIDVNSGRSTKEHNVEETAVKTNLEAADEIARQLRLRDMAGLIVIDFIDMDERSNNRSVEKRMKEALKDDRARIQMGGISSFGLIEMSRQRLRPNLLEASMEICPTCNGSGVVRSTESSALAILRALEEEGIRERSSRVEMQAPTEVALYLLNEKRTMLNDLEEHYGFAIVIRARGDLPSQSFEMERIDKDAETSGQESERDVVSPEAIAVERAADEETDRKPVSGGQPGDGASADAGEGEDGSQRKRPSKRRGRGRRGRGRKAQSQPGTESHSSSESEDGSQSAAAADPRKTAPAESGGGGEASGGEEKPASDEKGARPAKSRSRRGGRRRRSDSKAAEVPSDGAETEREEAPEAVSEAKSDKPAPRKRRRRKPAAKAAASEETASQDSPSAAMPVEGQGETEKAAASPRRRRRKPAEGSSDNRSVTPEKPAQQGAAADTESAAAADRLEHKVIAPDAPVAGAEEAKAEQPEQKEKGKGGGRKRGWWRRAIGK